MASGNLVPGKPGSRAAWWWLIAIVIIAFLIWALFGIASTPV